MSTSCCDICDKIITIICLQCPYYKSTCMPKEDDANHDQMLVCIDFIEQRIKGEFPEELVHPWQ